ncbi:hypothetical protein CR513_50210, partial [Mucuna pruriens]
MGLSLEGELIKLAHHRDLEMLHGVSISIQHVVFYAYTMQLFQFLKIYTKFIIQKLRDLILKIHTSGYIQVSLSIYTCRASNYTFSAGDICTLVEHLYSSYFLTIKIFS